MPSMTVLSFSVQVPLAPPALRRAATLWLLAAPLLLVAGGAQAQDKPVYRCPGNLYTDALSPKEAQSRGCKTLDGAPITVIQGPSSQRPQSGQSERPAGSGAGTTAPKVTSDEQRARDADRRRILEAELRKEEEALAALQKEFNNGEPERRGEERNYQKYMDRVSAMRDAVTRKEADVAALRRELAALGAAR